MKRLQEFEKSSMVLFVLLMGVNICNYLFQIIIGKLMIVEDYGVVNTILGIVGILSIPTTIITMISARYTAIFSSQKNNDGIICVLNLLFRFVLLIAGAFFFIGAAGMKEITDLFDLDSDGYVTGALTIAVLNLFFSVTAGTLQGIKRFCNYGIQSIIQAVGKLVISILLIVMQWRIYGVILAIIIATITAILYGLHYISEYIKKLFCFRDRSVIDIKEFLKYSLAAIIAQGCVITITNGDVLLVKLYFTDVVTGIYSSAAVISKIAMYVSTAMVATLFPMVVEKKQKGEDTISLFHKALFYGGAACIGIALILSFFGKLVIGFLFGERYREAVQYLPYVCMFIVPLTFITILMNYVLAIGRVKVFCMSIAMGVLGILGFSIWMHEVIEQMMAMAGAVLSVVFLLNMVWLQKEQKKYKERKIVADSHWR